MAERIHISLLASTAASVTVSSPPDGKIPVPGPTGTVYANVARDLRKVTLINHSTTDSVYYRSDGVNPTVQGDDAYALPPGGSWMQVVDADDYTVVFISTGIPNVSVIGESS